MSFWSAAWRRERSSESRPSTVVLEDFEHGDVSRVYAGETGQFKTQDADSYEGLLALEHTGSDWTERAITRTDVTVERGDTVSVRCNNLTVNSRSRLLLMVQEATGRSDLSAYGVGFSPENDSQSYVIFSKYEDGKKSSSNSALLPVDTTDWVELEVEITTDGRFNYQFYNPDGSEAATWSTTDTTYTKGGIGFTTWKQSPQWDYVTKTT